MFQNKALWLGFGFIFFSWVAPLPVARSEEILSAQELLSYESPEVSKEDLKEIDEALEGPKAIPREHIFVIQRRAIKKALRFEISPLGLGLQTSDSFRKQFQWNSSFGLHLNESLGWEILHIGFLTNIDSGLNASIQQQFGLATFRREPLLSLGTSLLWTPFISKAAGAEKIKFFEGYFLGGGGWTRYEDKGYPSAQWGLGFRLYTQRSSFLKVEIRDSIDFLGSSTHRVNFLMGWSLLLGGTP